MVWPHRHHAVVLTDGGGREVEGRHRCARSPACVRQVDGVLVVAQLDPPKALGVLVEIVEVVQGIHGPRRPEQVIACVVAKPGGNGCRIDRPFEGWHPSDPRLALPPATGR